MASAEMLSPPSWEQDLDRERVYKATSALCRYVTEQKEKSMNILEDDAEWIFLFVRYKSVPTIFRKFPIQLKLFKPFWNTEDFRICLIMHDKKAGKRVKAARQMLMPNHVTEVMSVREIQRQYRDVSLKKELCKSYDLFLLERSVKDISNELLGGRFVEMKKVPVLVHLTRRPEKWIEAIESEKQKTQVFCHVHQERSIRVGRSTFSAEELTENIFCIVRQMMERPELEKWSTIMQLYVCTGTSVRLPIYQTFPDPPPIEVEEQKDESWRRARKRRAESRQSQELTNRLMGAFTATDPPQPLPFFKKPDI